MKKGRAQAAAERYAAGRPAGSLPLFSASLEALARGYFVCTAPP
jgi:hypothetical protein